MPTGVYVRTKEHCEKIAKGLTKKRVIRICPRCGKEFLVIESAGKYPKYCSRKCFAPPKITIARICPVCSKEYQIPERKEFKGHLSKKYKYCSFNCMSEGEKVTQICPVCKKEFEITNNNRGSVYCSCKCAGIAKRKRVKLICQNCGKKFEVIKSQKGQKYCGKECRGTKERYVKVRNIVLRNAKAKRDIKKQLLSKFAQCVVNLSKY